MTQQIQSCVLLYITARN